LPGAIGEDQERDRWRQEHPIKLFKLSGHAGNPIGPAFNNGLIVIRTLSENPSPPPIFKGKDSPSSAKRGRGDFTKRNV
jgi:hypothetical protein